MNTLTTDKVYYSPEGKFFVSEREWPTPPPLYFTHYVCDGKSYETGQGAAQAYTESLSCCLSEGYEVTQGYAELKILTSMQGSEKPGMYTLPEPREFEVKELFATVKPDTNWIYAGHKLSINGIHTQVSHRRPENGREFDLNLIGTEFEKSRGYRYTYIWEKDLIIESVAGLLPPVSNDKQSEEQEKEIDQLKNPPITLDSGERFTVAHKNLSDFSNKMAMRLFQPERDELQIIIDQVIELQNKISSDWYVAKLNQELKSTIELQRKEIEGLNIDIAVLKADLKRAESYKPEIEDQAKTERVMVIAAELESEHQDTIELQRKEIEDWKEKHDLAYKCAEMRGMQIDGLVEGLKYALERIKDFDYKGDEHIQTLIHKHTPSESKQS